MEGDGENWQVCHSRRSKKQKPAVVKNPKLPKASKIAPKSNGYRDAVVKGIPIKLRDNKLNHNHAKPALELDLTDLTRHLLLIDYWIHFVIYNCPKLKRQKL